MTLHLVNANFQKVFGNINEREYFELKIYDIKILLKSKILVVRNWIDQLKYSRKTMVKYFVH